MGMLKIARAIGGLLSIMTLLTMVLLQFLEEDLVLEQTTVTILLLLIGALLGVDMIIEKGVNIKMGE